MAAVSQGRRLPEAGLSSGVTMLFTRPRFRSLAMISAIATIVLFAIGGLVRGTGSGLGCSTWPACEPGHLFPSGTVHSLIEFSHR
jgi:cytochrome c oxidase assembly protein subunit 15